MAVWKLERWLPTGIDGAPPALSKAKNRRGSGSGSGRLEASAPISKHFEARSDLK
jgi:hypothetical protein